MSDSDFRVFCTDHSTHPSREIAKLRWRGEDADPEIWEPMLTDPSLDPEDVQAVRGWDSVDVSAQRSARRGGTVYGSVVIERGVVHPQGPLWRFRCPTCKRDAPVRDERLRQIVKGFIDAGLSRLDISHLR